MAAQQLSDGSPEGTLLGRSTEKIAAYGGTPIAQRTGTSQATVTDNNTTIDAGVTNASAAFGFTTAAQLTQLTADVSNSITLLNEIRAALMPTTGVNIIKGSA